MAATGILILRFVLHLNMFFTEQDYSHKGCDFFVFFLPRIPALFLLTKNFDFHLRILISSSQN